jgi:hypothetical protein
MGAAHQVEPPGPLSGAYVRLLCAFAALAAGATAVVFVVSLLRALPPVASSATSSAGGAASTSSALPSAPSPQTSSGFPAPPRGAVVFGGQAGRDALGLAVVPKKRSVVLQASVLDQNGAGIRGLSVSFDVRGSGARQRSAASPCGAGCYRTTAAVARPQSVSVVIGRTLRVSFAMPQAWPPPPAAALVARASRVYKSLRTLVIHDIFGDGHASLNTVYRIVAPDKLTYQIQGGGDAVIIGTRRWDRPSGSTRWVTQAQTPIRQPAPFWVSAVDAHLLGTVSVAGRPAWKVSFFDPQTPGWYMLLIDKASLHTMDMQMTAHAHFMHDTYGSFNAPITITPPR